MMRRVMIVFLVIVVEVFTSSFSHSDIEKAIHIVFKHKQSQVKVDGLGNVFLISDMEISKFNSLGILQKTYSSKRYGHIDFVDVSNPLKIMVYYKDFQQVLFLDNQLSVSSSPISLENLGFEQSSLVCSSSNNSFWLYDKQNNSLCRFSSDSKLLVKTGNLKTLLGIDINPNFMIEHNGYLYLNACNNEGILLFDIYGTFYKAIAINELSKFSVVNEELFYFKDKTLFQYQPTTFNTIQKVFQDTAITDVQWHNNLFYKSYNDSLLIE